MQSSTEISVAENPMRPEFRPVQFRPLTKQPFTLESLHDQLTEDDVLRLKELPEGSRTHGLHGARLQVHQHGAGHVPRLVALAVVHGG